MSLKDACIRDTRIRDTCLVLVLLLLVFLLTALAQSSAQTASDVPGYSPDTPAESQYSHGDMFDDAEAKALTGDGMDARAARTITESFRKRPFVPARRDAPWLKKAGEGAENPTDFFSILSGSYKDCRKADIREGAASEAYDYACDAPAYRSKHASVAHLVPVCTDRRTACWKVTSQTNLLPYQYDGRRWIRLGEEKKDAIPDKWGRIHHYTATLTFEVTDLRDISRFRLDRIRYEDFVEITFNGHQVFSDLDRTQYTRVHTCGGCHVINRRMHVPLTVNLKPYLKVGANTLFVRLTAYAHGELFLEIDTDAACCRHWNDVWKATTHWGTSGWGTTAHPGAGE